MHGKVSIYINDKKHDESDALDEFDHKGSKNDLSNNNDEATNELIEALTLSNESKSKRLREKLGSYVISLGIFVVYIR